MPDHIRQFIRRLSHALRQPAAHHVPETAHMIWKRVFRVVWRVGVWPRCYWSHYMSNGVIQIFVLGNVGYVRFNQCYSGFQAFGNSSFICMHKTVCSRYLSKMNCWRNIEFYERPIIGGFCICGIAIAEMAKIIGEWRYRQYIRALLCFAKHMQKFDCWKAKTIA